MARVTFIGLGLDSEKGLSLEGLQEARRASSVFAEFYTNPMPNLNLQELESLLGKKVTILSREQLEDENGREIILAAERKDSVLLVPGDPLVSTTHVSVRLSLAERGINSRIIHAASIVTAVCGATGLQNHKFGKSTTLPNSTLVPSSIIDTVLNNKDRGLHTLLLLDTDRSKGSPLTIGNALLLLGTVLSELDDWLVVGAARIGSPDEKVRTARGRELKAVAFGDTPHTIVIPSRLHFMEAEALKVFSGASDTDLEDYR